MSNPSARIIEGMPMAEYQARPEVSSHDLMLIHKAPFAYRYAKDNPEEDEEMRFGSLMHLAILEPDLLAESVAILPAGAKAKPLPIHYKMKEEGRMSEVAKERFEFWDEWNEKSKGKANVSAKDIEKIQGMHKSLLATPNVRDAIQLPGLIEAVGLFTHHGVSCKMRPDLWTENEIIDLKSTGDCSRESFSREIYNKRYHQQSSLYMEGSAKVGRPAKQFIWIAVETKAPFLCSIHYVKRDHVSLRLGEVDNYRALLKYEECTRTGFWPGVRQYSEEIELPTYAQ